MATKKTGTSTRAGVRLKATSTGTGLRAGLPKPKRAPKPPSKGGLKSLPKGAPKPTPKGGPKTPLAAKAPKPAPSAIDTPVSRASRDRAVMCAAAGLEKKAQGIEIVDVTGKVDYADFLVLMTGGSDRHVASIVQSVEDAAKKAKSRPLAVEGMPTAEWVLVDLGDVVVHVFQEGSRSLYDIDGLWMDAGRVPLPERARE